MFVAFECLYCHLWISASSSGISVPLKKENCLHAAETWWAGIWAQSNKRILIAISFAFSYGRRITLDWRGGEHLAEKWHKWQTVAEGSVKYHTGFGSLEWATSSVSCVIKILPSSPLLAVEMIFDADQVTSERRKRLCFNIFVCRMMVLIRFSIAALKNNFFSPMPV